MPATRLSPGYVRRHRRIVSATCGRSPWDGSMTFAATVVSRGLDDLLVPMVGQVETSG